MGNSWSDQVYFFIANVYTVLRQKINVYMYGQLTQGPVGLSLNEMNEFTNQFQSFVLKRRYGHRLDAPVSDEFKVVIDGAEALQGDTIVVPCTKSEIDPFVLPFDQLDLNCSTTNAVSLLVQWFMNNLNNLNSPHTKPASPYAPSRLYLYYEARVNPSREEELLDEGVSFSDVFAVLNLNIPIPDELEWPYNVKAVHRKPGKYESALCTEYIPFVGVQLKPTLNNLRTCLEKNGPFVAAVSVTKEFELHATYSYNDSMDILGFQPLLFTRYLEDSKKFIAVNSFGQSWGDRGTVTLNALDLFRDPAFTSSIYTLVEDLDDDSEEKSD